MVCRSNFLLERLGRERAANKLRHVVPSKIAGGTCDDQFLEVAQLDQSARGRTTHDPLKLKQSVQVIHVVAIFSQPKTTATASRMRLAPGLIFDQDSCDTSESVDLFFDLLRIAIGVQSQHECVHRYRITSALLQRFIFLTHLWRTPRTLALLRFKVGLKSHSVKSSDVELLCLSATVTTSTN